MLALLASESLSEERREKRERERGERGERERQEREQSERKGEVSGCLTRYATRAKSLSSCTHTHTYIHIYIYIYIYILGAYATMVQKFPMLSLIAENGRPLL